MFLTGAVGQGNGFAVQHRFYQFVTVIAQLQQEEGGIGPQKIQKDPVALPLGQAAEEVPADPLEISFFALLQSALKAVGGEQVHIFPVPWAVG